jgi:D-inositol-3-phosphate glycosyltransferase
MRILFTSHYALPHLGGIEVAIDGLARALVHRGHDVVHLASTALRSGESSSGEWSRDRPYALHRVPAANGFEERLGVPWPLFSPRLVTELRRQVARADVVHAHGFLYMPTPMALALARRRAPVAARVLTEHVGRVGYRQRAVAGVERAAVATLGAASIALSQAVIVLNPTVRELIERRAGRRPVAWIPNGVDLDAYRPPSAGERERLRADLGWDERPRSLFVGRLVEKKGIGLAMRAAEVAGVELVVVGPGDLFGELPAGVTVLGPLPRERVAQLYRAADVLVLPSRGEGFPITAQEALASGLPVVLLDDPAYVPYMSDAHGALRLSPRTPEALGAAVSELAGAGGDVRAEARDHAERLFAWERAAEAHEELYLQLRRASL